jgi:hypothetical protein
MLAAANSGYVSIHPIEQSNAPELFPDQVLDLLWLIFGPTGGSSFDLANILDRLRTANPEIEIDRRFRSLEQRAIRYR